MTADQQLAKWLWTAAQDLENQADWDADFGTGGREYRKYLRTKAGNLQYRAACLDPKREFKEEI